MTELFALSAITKYGMGIMSINPYKPSVLFMAHR